MWYMHRPLLKFNPSLYMNSSATIHELVIFVSVSIWLLHRISRYHIAMLLILFDNVSGLIKLKLSNRIEDTISFSQTDSNFTTLGFFSVENGWVNDGEAGDLRCHRAHYDVIVIIPPKFSHITLIRCRESIRLIYHCVGTTIIWPIQPQSEWVRYLFRFNVFVYIWETWTVIICRFDSW